MIFSDDWIVEPSNGPLLFRLKIALDFGVAIAVCATLAIVMSLVVPVVIGDLVAVGISMYLYLALLRRRGISVRCKHCRKCVSSKTPWVCGFCGEKNEDVDDFPFIHRCKHCSAPPKSYKCHHVKCGQLIFLSSDCLEKNYAQCYTSEVVREAPTRSAIRQEERSEIEHEAFMAAKNAEMAAAKRRLESPRIKSISEQTRDSLNEHYDSRMSAFEWADLKLREAAEKYKNDPVRYQQAKEAVEQWLNDNA